MALLARATRAGTTSVVHCDLDDWDYDARFTDGACPICGAIAPGWPRPKSRLAQVMDAVEWDYVGLVVLFVVLVALGLLVAQTSGILPNFKI